jgi:response regulator RpfG family c-di-GMP phosphodiesterase
LPSNNILVCDEPEAVERLIKAIGTHYELILAQTVEDAVSLIKSGRISLVICGENFDGSRMLELLGIVKSDEKTRDLPFLCFRHLHSRFSAEVMQGVKMSAEQLGACHFIDEAFHLKDEEIRKAVEECILQAQPA